MSQRIPDELQRAMEEAATLSPEAPRRQAVVKRVKAAGPEAEAAWLELLEDDERLRLALRDVPVPAELEAALLEIPAAHPHPRDRRTIQLGGLAAAAVAALAVLLGVWSWMAGPSNSEASDAVQRVAALAVEHHVKHPELTVRSSQPHEVASALATASGMPVHLPDLGPEYELMGGRVCELGGKRVIYTCWRRNGKMHSVYQLEGEAFGLPEVLPARRIDPAPAPGQHRGQHELVLWSGERCVYAMVGDRNGTLPETSPRSDRRPTPIDEPTEIHAGSVSARHDALAHL